MSVFKETLTKDKISLIQKALNDLWLKDINVFELYNLDKDEYLVTDGIFGRLSVNRLREVQSKHGFEITGVYDGSIKELCENLIKTKYINLEAITRVAKEYSLEVAVVRAIMDVESKGSGFLVDGRPIILFERHIMRREYAKKVSADRLTRAINRASDVINSRTGGYQGGNKEWLRLSLASGIDNECALLSASWGLGQVMGFNYKLAGYTSVQDFVAAMHDSEENQLRAMISFIYNNKNIYNAAKKKDWAAFARGYNGSNYAQGSGGGYHNRLATAYKKYA